MAAVQPVEINEKGHSVYRWSAEWPECCWWKADKHTLVLEEDEVDYTIEHAPNCCNSYAHMRNPCAHLMTNHIHYIADVSHRGRCNYGFVPAGAPK